MLLAEKERAIFNSHYELVEDFISELNFTSQPAMLYGFSGKQQRPKTKGTLSGREIWVRKTKNRNQPHKMDPLKY